MTFFNFFLFAFQGEEDFIDLTDLPDDDYTGAPTEAEAAEIINVMNLIKTEPKEDKNEFSGALKSIKKEPKSDVSFNEITNNLCDK